MNIVLNILLTIVAIAAGGFVGYSFIFKNLEQGLEKRKEKAEELVKEAEIEAKEIKDRTHGDIETSKKRIAEGLEMSKKMLDQMDVSLKNKELNLQKQEERLKKIKILVAEMEEETSAKQNKIAQVEGDFTNKLAEKSGKQASKVKEEILIKYKYELEEENKENLAKYEEYLKEKAPRKAKKVIINAIQRLCSPTSVEPRAIELTVPRDIVKGKIVGKNAQNILHLEEKLTIDVIFNDLPNTISISSYNLMERRIGQKTIEKLIHVKSEIDPKVIDEAIRKSKEEIKEELFEIGQDALRKMGITKLPTQDKEFVRTVGRLKFRTSYSQNIMLHSMEVGYFATMLGSELGLDVEVCKVAGFLHDLGKAIDQDPDVQGAHDFLTKELMEKYGFSKEMVHAAWTHHESEKPATPEALIIQAADALSASRPGARQESLDKYLERLNALEDIAMSFPGVRKTFAISAGREIRAIVDPMEISDEALQDLANNIAQKIEVGVKYPGKIKVNVIRKTKTTETAK